MAVTCLPVRLDSKVSSVFSACAVNEKAAKAGVSLSADECPLLVCSIAGCLLPRTSVVPGGWRQVAM